MSAILKAVAAAIQAVLRFTDAMLATVFGMFGRTAPSISRRLPDLSVRTDDIEDEFHNTYSRTLRKDLLIGSDVGLNDYRYASATEPLTRAAVDLSCLKMETMDWILALSDKHLGQLAEAGPKACELAAAGKYSGIVKLPLPSNPSATVAGKADAVRELFVGRIRDNRRWDRGSALRQQFV